VSDSYVSDLRQGEVPSSVRGSSISITEKSNRGNSSDSVDTRVLFSSMSLNRQSMQVSYNRLKNPSKNLWCNRQAKRDRQKLVNQTSSGPRLPYFLGKVSDTSFPRLPVFGGTLQDRFRSDFSPRGKISVTLSPGQTGPPETGKLCCSRQIGEISCNRGSSSDSVDTRVLFSSLLGSQENWGNETCDRSLYSEQLPFCSPFQNGDQQVYQSLYSSRYVDHQTGPFGCLFPYPNFFGFQERLSRRNFLYYSFQ
jgi:hypothetical protein